MSDLASREINHAEPWLADAPAAVREAIVGHSGEFHALMGSDLRLQWVSDSVSTVLGYSPGQLAERSARTVIHPEDYRRYSTAIHELSDEAEGRRRLQYRIRHADGNWRWIETEMTNLLDRPGVRGIITTTRDVTSRVATKSRLSLSERRLRSIVSSAGDIVVLLDADMNVDYVTPTAAALLECPTAVVQNEWASLIHEGDVPVLGMLLESALGDAGVTKGPVDLRLLRSDGVWLTLEALATDYIADPIIRGIVINARDVTSRRRVESERTRNQTMFNALVELAPVGIFLADTNGDWTYANARVTDEFGIETADLLATGWTALFDSADVERLRTELTRWNGSGRYVTELRTRGGPDAREVKVTISQPDSAGIVGTIEDVTHRRELDEMLIDAAALGSLSEVVGSAAHDIHNLLSSIGLQLGLLDNVAEADRVSAANEAVDRACDITEDLMSISRPAHRRVVAVGIGPLLDDLADMLEVLVEHQADLIVETPGANHVAMADRTGLERVITNLVINALDAVEARGRITLRVSTIDLDSGPTPFDEAVALDSLSGRYVTVSVSDDGCGIPESAMEKIFDPYFTTKIKGNGIGLAASRKNVRSWGGDIVVSSAEQKGTTVTVLLPVEPTIG